ncbi:hypothetical protein Micbo1qcDRAFT_175127 [Microdochium bolleyi]|uniref:Uncharacterized protein n=1 Tax=Microdochium bolleyi TaxID=196109 RepID=A0A136J4L7_9PEZI|nr:hypothetical protein Micbo1qcDRAFT_175127 [Microdochium bolleyi]
MPPTKWKALGPGVVVPGVELVIIKRGEVAATHTTQLLAKFQAWPAGFDRHGITLLESVGDELSRGTMGPGLVREEEPAGQHGRVRLERAQCIPSRLLEILSAQTARWAANEIETAKRSRLHWRRTNVREAVSALLYDKYAASAGKNKPERHIQHCWSRQRVEARSLAAAQNFQL